VIIRRWRIQEEIGVGKSKIAYSCIIIKEAREKFRR